METEDYTGPVSGMKDSPWLASEDIIGIEGGVDVTIERVHRHANAIFDQGRVEAQVYSLKFEHKEKEMVLNATNRRTLSMNYGALTADWIGKRIKIFVQHGVRKPGGRKGETTTGLRIKPVSEATVIEGWGN